MIVLSIDLKTARQTLHSPLPSQVLGDPHLCLSFKDEDEGNELGNEETVRFYLDHAKLALIIFALEMLFKKILATILLGIFVLAA